MIIPEGLKERGSALWQALDLDPATPRGALALEACRTADRLDELDSVVAGKGVLKLMSFRLDLDLEDEFGDRQVEVKVEFSNVLAEARQQQMAFKQMITILLADDEGSAPTAAKGTPLDELREKRRLQGQPGTANRDRATR